MIEPGPGFWAAQGKREYAMEQYVIKGGNPLVGEVEIGGAKNEIGRASCRERV